MAKMRYGGGYGTSSYGGGGHKYSGDNDKRTDAETMKKAHESTASWSYARANVKASRLPGDGAPRKARKRSMSY